MTGHLCRSPIFCIQKKAKLIPQERPIDDDGYPDVAIYNKELEQLGNPTWLNVSWLYCECYLFRFVPHRFRHENEPSSSCVAI